MNNTSSVMSRVMFFILSAGCKKSLLSQCSESVKEGRYAMAAVLIVVVLISSIMAGTAWYTVTSRIEVGITIGILWFILFLVIDSALMASLDGLSGFASTKGGSTLKRLLTVARALILYGTRFALIAVIAHFNAKAVNIVIYQPEIEQVILTNNQQRMKVVAEKRNEAAGVYKKTTEGWLNLIENEKNVKEQFRAAGNEARALEIEEGIKAKTIEMKKIRLEGVEAVALKNAEAEVLRVEIENKKPIGMADRDAILTKIGESNPFVPLMYWMFLLVEALAFIVKFFRPNDQYDHLIEKEHQEAKDVELKTT